MSYTIMYDRQFLKTSRGIIPLALYGDNNVTERVNGHERRERHWGVYANSKTEFTPDEYMSLIQSWCGSEFQEHFVFRGKWVDDNGIIAWAKNGIKNALTIEETREIVPVQSITCYISVWGKDYSHRSEEWRYCDTTEQLEQWLDMAYARKKELSADPSRKVFICLSYLRQEPLKLSVRQEPDGEVIIRKENRYLSEVADKGYTFSSDIADALVFKNTAEARNLAARCGQPFLYKARFISADNKFAVRNYRIIAILPEYPNGVYIQRLTRNALRFCHESKHALKFASEQQAQKYIAKLGNRFQRVINYSVVKAKEA